MLQEKETINQKQDIEIYKSNQKIIKFKAFILFLICILTTSSAVYAGVATYKTIQENTYTNFQAVQNFEYSKDMISNNNMYYKKIYSFEDYKEAQKIKKYDFTRMVA